MQYKMSLKYLLVIFFIALASWYFYFAKPSTESMQETTAASKSDKETLKKESQNVAKNSGKTLQNNLAETQIPKKIRIPKLNSEPSFRSVPTQELKKHLISQLDSSWQWVVNLSAIPKHLYKGSLNDSYGEANNHILYENRQNVSSPDEFFIENPMILYNQNRQKYGLLTGVFIATAKSQEDFKRILEDKNYEVVNSFPNLHLVFLRPLHSPFSFNDYAQALRGDQRISQIEYEILNMNWVKN